MNGNVYFMSPMMQCLREYAKEAVVLLTLFSQGLVMGDVGAWGKARCASFRRKLSCHPVPSPSNLTQEPNPVT